MAEKKVIEIEIKDNSKSLKAQYKEAVLEVQRLADAFGETSIEVANAAKKAAELKDKIEDVNDAIQAQKGEGKFIALGKSVTAVASGFSAVQGAMGLVGVESEELQKTMLRVQSAMALAQGLEGLEDAGRAFKQLGTVAVNAFKGIRGAIAATGIGLLLIAVGTLVAYWDDIKAAVNGVSKEQAKLNELTHKNFETSKEELSTLDSQDNVLKLQGKSERQILNLKIKKIDTTLEQGKIELQNVIKTSKAEEQAAIKNYKLTKQIVDLALDSALLLPKLMLLPIDLAIKGANKVSEALGFGKLIAFDMGKTMDDLQTQFAGFIAGSIFNVDEVKEEGEKTRKALEKELEGLENQQAGFKLTLRDLDKPVNKKEEPEKTEAIDLTKDPKYIAEQQRLAELNKLELESIKAIEDAKKANQERVLSEQEIAIQKENEAYKIKFDNAVKFGQDTEELEIEHLNNINDINLTAQEKAYENEKIAAEKSKELKEKSIADAKELFEKNLKFFTDATVEVLGIISDMAQMQQDKIASMNKAIMDNDKLTEKEKKSMIQANEARARKSFENAKKANIAATLIATYMSARQAYASQFLPIPDPTSPVRGAVAAGLSVAQGLMAVAKIKATQFNGGGGGGGSSSGGGGGDGGVVAPNLNVVGDTGINQLATLQQQPVKAYVVSNDVTSAQQFDMKVQQTAQI